MANIRTVDLSTASSIASNDTVVANVSGVTKKVMVSAILENIQTDIIDSKGTKLENGSDLNDVTTKGIYYGISSTILNRPDNMDRFKLIVFQLNVNTSIYVQIFIGYSMTDNGTTGIYYRFYMSNSSSFTSWVRMGEEVSSYNYLDVIDTYEDFYNCYQVIKNHYRTIPISIGYSLIGQLTNNYINSLFMGQMKAYNSGSGTSAKDGAHICGTYRDGASGKWYSATIDVLIYEPTNDPVVEPQSVYRVEYSDVHTFS